MVGKALGCVKRVLADAIAQLEDLDVKKLQQAVSVAAQAGLAGMMELWNHLQAAVEELIAAGRELAKVEMPSMKEVKQMVSQGMFLAGEAYYGIFVQQCWVNQILNCTTRILVCRPISYTDSSIRSRD